MAIHDISLATCFSERKYTQIHETVKKRQHQSLAESESESRSMAGISWSSSTASAIITVGLKAVGGSSVGVAAGGYDGFDGTYTGSARGRLLPGLAGAGVSIRMGEGALVGGIGRM